MRGGRIPVCSLQKRIWPKKPVLHNPHRDPMQAGFSLAFNALSGIGPGVIACLKTKKTESPISNFSLMTGGVMSGYEWRQWQHKDYG